MNTTSIVLPLAVHPALALAKVIDDGRHLITLSVHVCRTKMTTRLKFGTKFQKKVLLFSEMRYPYFFFKKCTHTGGESLCAKTARFV